MTFNKINYMCYIGKCEYHRKNNWKSYLGSGVYLKKAIKKYGSHNFDRVILKEASSKDELESMEEYYLKLFKVVESPRFYNLKYSSVGGDTFTNHPNQKNIRLKKSENTKGVKNPRFNCTYSPETKSKISKANSKEIIVDTIEYSSITEYANKFNIGKTTVVHRLRSPNFENYTYKNNQNVSNKGKTRSNVKKPVIIDNILYDSLNEAVETIGRSKSYIKFRLNSEDFPNYKYI